MWPVADAKDALVEDSGVSDSCSRREQAEEDERDLGSGVSCGMAMLRDDVVSLVFDFVDIALLASSCALGRRFRVIAGAHDHWRCFVLQHFGVYYEDYMHSVDVCDLFRWRRLFVYIRHVHDNVDGKHGVRRVLPKLLRPCAWMEEEPGAPAGTCTVRPKSGHAPRRRRRYRGSLELADNCNVFFWENGRMVQVVCAKTGQVLREIDTGQMFRRYFHRLANVKNKLFVCLNDCIQVWEYGADDAHKLPVELPPPVRLPKTAKVGRPLELLVHRRRLILLESNCCLLWDTDTLNFVCCIQHDEGHEVGAPENVGDVGDAPSGRRAVAGVTATSIEQSLGDMEENRALEVQWMGDLIVTWVRGASVSLKVWTLEGAQVAHLQMDSPLVQVDVARVTWVSVETLDHFILAALDARSVISLWDSKRNFEPIFRFYCGCEEPFDLVLTQDFLAVVNDNVAENCLELCFWKLWFHPSFELDAEVDVAEAARRRANTVDSSGSPAAGQQFAVSGAGLIHTNGGAGGLSGQLGLEQLHRWLLKELRPNAQPVKKFNIPDIDSYFASYRNFLNVCSFHKSGQESLSVYRSSSLQKKVFFPPAKHTKFEEWLALQVLNDGTVVLHDFRPNLLAFDEIDPEKPRKINYLEVAAGKGIESKRHARKRKGARNRDR